MSSQTAPIAGNQSFNNVEYVAGKVNNLNVDGGSMSVDNLSVSGNLGNGGRTL